MVTTKLINSSGRDLSLKEGSAGIYRDLKTLSNGDRYWLEIDLNATYREYLIVDRTSDWKWFITSDDCIDTEVITVVYGEKFDFILEPRGRNREASGSVPWWKRAWKRLRDPMG